MKVIDTFMFSEDFEKDLLWLKLYCEDSLVDLFIGIEGEYTFRGQYKGLQLQRLIDTDPKFEPYRHKFKVITKLGNMCRSQNETEYCYVSDTQRSYAQDYIFDNFKDEDFVIISDIDEMFDGTNEWRHRRFKELLTLNKPLDIERLRYWFDYDNMGSFPEMEISIPVFPIWAFKNKQVTWKDRKWHGQHIKHFNNSYLAFEYSSCFSKENIQRKHDTFAHDRFTPEDLDLALACNHWPMRNNAVVDKHDPSQWFKKVTLDNSIAPQYVVDHLELIRTNVVFEDYIENRRKIYNI